MKLLSNALTAAATCKARFNYLSDSLHLTFVKFNSCFSAIQTIFESCVSRDCLFMTLRIKTFWFGCWAFEESTCHPWLFYNIKDKRLWCWQL